MNEDLKKVVGLFREGIRSLTSPRLDEIEKALSGTIESLIDEGAIALGPDHNLGSRGLESRVRRIFREMGFEVEKGPEGSYNALVATPEGWQPEYPLVIEIKSGKAAGPVRSDLRQLDDWVFEISGEELARKGKGIAPGNLITQGFGGSSYSHPSPHKGVMVYNGPLGTPLQNRSRDDSWLGANEKEFAAKRAFCVVSLHCLLEWLEACQKDKSTAQELWKAIHSSTGVLSLP